MAKRRGRRRQRKNGCLYNILSGGFLFSVVSFLLVVGAIVASVIVFLKVADVEVSGTTRYDTTEIIKTSGIETGDNMFLVNKFEVAEKILNEYPYIEQIKIRRKLPDTFTFEIVERVPVAYIIDDSNIWVLDSNAYIVEMVPEGEQMALPKIWGAEAVAPKVGSELVLRQEDQLVILKEVLSALRQTEMHGSVARIEIDKLYDIRLVYGNRFMVCLGDSLLLTKKINMLKAVLGKVNEYDKGTIDVSLVKEARFRPDNNIDLSERIIIPEKDETEDGEEVTEDASGTESEAETETEETEEGGDSESGGDEETEAAEGENEVATENE